MSDRYNREESTLDGSWRDTCDTYQAGPFIGASLGGNSGPVVAELGASVVAVAPVAADPTSEVVLVSKVLGVVAGAPAALVPHWPLYQEAIVAKSASPH